MDAPTVGIITDYTLHPYWEEVPRVEYIVTASELLTHRALKKGIAASRILPFGIRSTPSLTCPSRKRMRARGWDSTPTGRPS